MKTSLLRILSVVGAVFLGCSDEPNSQGDTSCDLGEKTCIVAYNGGQISVSLSPRPLAVMTPLTLKVSGLGPLASPNAHISGINMDMGVIIADLERDGADYVAKVVISSCVVREMHYWLSFYDGDKPIGARAYFVLRN